MVLNFLYNFFLETIYLIVFHFVGLVSYKVLSYHVSLILLTNKFQTDFFF